MLEDSRKVEKEILSEFNKRFVQTKTKFNFRPQSYSQSNTYTNGQKHYIFTQITINHTLKSSQFKEKCEKLLNKPDKYTTFAPENLLCVMKMTHF